MQIVHADNYICVQDLSRFFYTTKSETAACTQPPQVPESPVTMKDHLRLDVTVSEGNEIYAWHGANSFSSKSLMDVVQNGPVSSGGFTGYLRNIFISAGIEFTHREMSIVDGISVYNFDYRVPLKASRFQVNAGNSLVVVPFHGSFTARADNLQIQKLTVTADGNVIPTNADLCAIQSTVVYKLAHISAEDSLIPASFNIIYGSSGARTITESRGNYSQCRQFSGESTVRFDADEATAKEATVDVEAAIIKAGTLLRIALASEIDSASAYAGMPVEGTLVHPAKIGNGVLIPGGTKVEGLLTRFETRYSPWQETILIIEFNRMTAGRKMYTFRAIHVRDLYEMTTVPVGGRRMGQTRGISSPYRDEGPGVLSFSHTKIHLDQKYVNTYETVPAK